MSDSSMIDGMYDEPCDLPPAGWACTRPKGHEGACAGIPIPATREPSLPADVVNVLQKVRLEVPSSAFVADVHCLPFVKGKHADVLTWGSRAFAYHATDGDTLVYRECFVSTVIEWT